MTAGWSVPSGDQRIRVAVVGAGGRMGATVCKAVEGASDLALVAAVDPMAAGCQATPGGLVIAADLGAVAESEASMIVDFTVVDAARETLAWCASRHLHAVVGTTGFSADDLDDIGGWFPRTGTAGCIVAPNFAIGAILMMRFAELASPWFDTAEIVELHHNAKRDAPSGTALRTAERMAAARAAAGAGDWAADPTTTEVVAGARGGVGPAGLHLHAVRLQGLVAHQEVLLGTSGETLTVRHDSYERSSFMPGVLLAVRGVAGRPGLTVGLDPLLGLD
jgi:4-hydroxy-tetrahydrodipicolinate reductase